MSAPTVSAERPSGTQPRGWRGPRLVALCAAILIAGSLAILWIHGSDRAGLGVLLRATARTSLLLFLAAFLAAPLRRALRNPTTAWLVSQRRYLGLSFAVSHGIHLLAIFAVALTTDEVFDPVTVAGGGLAYVFIAAMAATSNDAAVRKLGRTRWQLLHRTGQYYLWLIFALTYLGSAGDDPLAALALGLLVAALLARLWFRRRHGPQRDGAAA